MKKKKEKEKEKEKDSSQTWQCVEKEHPNRISRINKSGSGFSRCEATTQAEGCAATILVSDVQSPTHDPLGITDTMVYSRQEESKGKRIVGEISRTNVGRWTVNSYVSFGIVSFIL